MQARTPEFLIFKRAVKDCLDHFLYAPVRKAFQAKLNELIIADAVARGDGIRAFCHRGRNFMIPGEKPNFRYFPRLSRSNRVLVDSLLSEYDPVLIDERDSVLTFISQVLNKSDEPSEYLKMFPSGLREPLKRVYEHFGLPVEGVEFPTESPIGSNQAGWDKLCTRVGINLVLGGL